MNTTVDRIERAYADVVAVEEVAPGLMRVCSWSDQYVVDARGDGCGCPDKMYNLDDTDMICKHRVAAIVATRDDLPGPWDPAETLDTRDGEARGVMADGGVVVDDVDTDEVEGWAVHDETNDNIRVEDSRRDAGERAEYARDEFGVDTQVYPPGEHPHLSDDEAAEVSDAAAFDPSDYDDASAAIQDAPTQEDAEAAMRHFNPDASDEVADDKPDTAADKLDAETPEVVDAGTNPQPADTEAVAEAAEQLPDERHVDEDPLDWLPGAFVDTIDNTPAINRKGFEVLGHFYDVDVTTDLEVAPEETEHEYARVKAYASIGDREVEAYGSAHVDRGDDSFLLLEMADTRAKKRALSLATGAGAVAVEELTNEPEGGR